MQKSSSQNPFGAHWPIYLAGLAGVAIVGFLIWGSQQSNESPEPTAQTPPAETEPSKPEDPPIVMPSGFAIVGGVSRPETDVNLSRRGRINAEKKIPLKRQGHPSILTGKENTQVEQVVQALKTGAHPERFNSFAIPQSFDTEAFKANPRKYANEYANTVEPGRVFATAQPDAGVEALRSKSKSFHRLRQGEAVRLSVEGEPNAPVSFLSMDHGEFSNRLNSITVVADESGVATTEFKATRGAYRDVSILAGSPLSSGQVMFAINVRIP